MVSMNELKQDMITGMGYIGLDSGRLYRMRRGPKLIEAVASGTTIIINDATEGRPFRGLRVFGKSTQDGAPTPEAPVPIVSAGESGNINVEVKGGNLFDKTGYRPEMDISIPSGTTILASLEETADEFTVDIINVDGSTHVLSLDKSKDHRKYGTRTLTRDSRTIRFRGITETPFLAVSNEYIPYKPYRDPQSLTLQTPNGLPGVPVSKDGNYTDKNGQQWVCDEIDLERGKYVQRVAEKDIYESQNTWGGQGTWGNIDNNNTLGFHSYINGLNGEADWGRLAIYAGMCNYFGLTSNLYQTSIIGFTIGDYVAFRVPRELLPDWDETNPSSEPWTNWLRKQKEAGNPVIVRYALKTSIERDLTPEEITAYKALRTYGPTTVVSNDAGAEMEVTYVADRKEN